MFRLIHVQQGLLECWPQLGMWSHVLEPLEVSAEMEHSSALRLTISKTSQGISEAAISINGRYDIMLLVSCFLTVLGNIILV